MSGATQEDSWRTEDRRRGDSTWPLKRAFLVPVSDSEMLKDVSITNHQDTMEPAGEEVQ